MYSEQAYYNNSWSPTMHAINYAVDVPCPQIQSNRAVYINRNFTSNSQVKVLVNPNFKRNVHINPNFSNPLLPKSQNVYVNPSVFRQQPQPVPPAPPPEPKPIEATIPSMPYNKPTVPLRPSVSQKPHVPIRVSRFSKINNVSMQAPTHQIYHINRAPAVKKYSPFSKINFAGTEVTPDWKIVNSKYKIVRSSTANKNKLPVVLNKFKLDNRPNSTIKTKAKMSVKAYLMNLDPQRQIIKKSVYKYSRSTKQSVMIRKMPKVVKIKGNTYRFSSNYKILHKLTCSTKFVRNKVKKITISGITYVQKDSKTFVRQYANNLVKINSKVLKKDNNPCLIYRKTGRCKAHQTGKCIKQHDPRQISVCIRFLQGACHDKDCPLSHIVSLEKMPTCKYFLEGRCSNDDCPYLHVKLSKNSDICKNFLEGYCTLGFQCMNRHQFLCPTFEKTGACRKRKCPYPHGDVVRQYTNKIVNKIARSTVRGKKVEKIVRKKGKEPELDVPHRYYREESSGREVIVDAGDIVDADFNVDLDSSEPSLHKRPKLGELPSFIALED